MTSVNAPRVAFDLFLHTAIGTAPGSAGSLLSRGLLRESRLLAACGMACGYFASEDVTLWLQNTDRRVGRELGEPGGEDEQRMPPPLSSKALHRRAEAISETDSGQAAFQQVLLLRKFANMHTEPTALLLLASNDTWDRHVARLRQAEQQPLAVSPAVERLIDGVIGGVSEAVWALTLMRAEGYDGELEGENPFPTPPLVAVDGLRKDPEYLQARLESARTALDAYFSPSLAARVEADKTGGEETDQSWSLLTELMRARVCLWSLATQPVGSYGPMSFLEELDERTWSASRYAEDLLPFAESNGELFWCCMLWRLAPVDPRSRSRLREVATLITNLFDRPWSH